MRISDWSSDVCSSDLAPLSADNPVLQHDVTNIPLSSWAEGRRQPDGNAPAFGSTPPLRLARPLPGRLRRPRGPETGSWPSSAHGRRGDARSEEHTSELQSLMRISYAVFCLKKKNIITHNKHITLR